LPLNNVIMLRWWWLRTFY